MDTDISVPASSSALTLLSEESALNGRMAGKAALANGKSDRVPEDVHVHSEKHDAGEVTVLSKFIGVSSPTLSNCSSHSASPSALSPSSAASTSSYVNCELDSKDMESDAVEVVEKSVQILKGPAVEVLDSHGNIQILSGNAAAPSARAPNGIAPSDPVKNNSDAHLNRRLDSSASKYQNGTALTSPNAAPTARSPALGMSPPILPLASAHSPSSYSTGSSSPTYSSSGHASTSGNGGMRSKLKDRLKHSQSEQRRRSRLRERFDYLAQLLAQTKSATMPLDSDGSSQQSVDDKSMINERRDRFTVLNSAIERLHAFNRKVNSLHREIEKLKRNAHSPTAGMNGDNRNTSPVKTMKSDHGSVEEDMQEDGAHASSAAPCAPSVSSMCFGKHAEQLASLLISAVKRNPHAACELLRGAPVIRVDRHKQQLLDSNAAWKEIHRSVRSDASGSPLLQPISSASSSSQLFAPFHHDTALQAINATASSANADGHLQIIPIGARVGNADEKEEHMSSLGIDGGNSMEGEKSRVEDFGMLLCKKEKSMQADSGECDVLATFLPMALLPSSSFYSSNRKRSRAEVSDLVDVVSMNSRVHVKSEEDESKAKRARKVMSATSPAGIESDSQMPVYPSAGNSPSAAAQPRYPMHMSASAPMPRAPAYLTGDGLVYEAPPTAAIYDAAHAGADAVPALAATYLPGHYVSAAPGPAYGLVAGGRYMNPATAYDMWHPGASVAVPYGAAAYYARPVARAVPDANAVRYYSEPQAYPSGGAAPLAYSNPMVDASTAINGSGSRYALSSSTIRNKVSASASSLPVSSPAVSASAAAAMSLSSANSVGVLSRSPFK